MLTLTREVLVQVIAWPTRGALVRIRPKAVLTGFTALVLAVGSKVNQFSRLRTKLERTLLQLSGTIFVF